MNLEDKTVDELINEAVEKRTKEIIDLVKQIECDFYMATKKLEVSQPIEYVARVLENKYLKKDNLSNTFQA